MKAMLYHASGGPEVLEYTDVADPVPGAGDVVLDVAVTALNRLDVLQRNGWYHAPGFFFPHIAGMDIAGVVSEVGAEVTEWQPGDRVIADASMVGVPENSKYAGMGDPYSELGILGATPRRRLRREVPGAGLRTATGCPITSRWSRRSPSRPCG